MKFRNRNEPEETTQSPVYQGCKYGGCKMPAGIVLEPNVYVCRLHDGISFTDADKVTNMTRNRRLPYRLAYVLVNAPAGAEIPEQAIAKLQQMGYGRALTPKTDTARKLAYSLMRILDDECTAHVTEPPTNTVKPAASNDDWFHAGETALARFMS